MAQELKPPPHMSTARSKSHRIMGCLQWSSGIFGPCHGTFQTYRKIMGRLGTDPCIEMSWTFVTAISQWTTQRTVQHTHIIQ